MVCSVGKPFQKVGPRVITKRKRQATKTCLAPAVLLDIQKVLNITQCQYCTSHLSNAFPKYMYGTSAFCFLAMHT